MKRFRIKDFIAGRSTKEFNASVLSGSAGQLLSGNGTEVWTDLYVAGQQGDLLSSPVVSADSTIYNVGFFEREYSIENPDLISIGTDLQYKATDSDIIDAIQFGDLHSILQMKHH